MSTKLVFKNDKFRKNRGGYSRLLLLSCEKCKNNILYYQKDGPGMLKRLYLDRIIAFQGSVGKNLICKKCKTVLGVSTVWQKENRLAYRLFAGAIYKKIVKGNELPKIDF